MDECELITIVTAVACGISKCCPDDDIAIMAAVFTQLGDTLATVLAKREIKESNTVPSGNVNPGQNKAACNVSTDMKYNNCTVYYKDPGSQTGADASGNNANYYFY